MTRRGSMMMWRAGSGSEAWMQSSRRLAEDSPSWVLLWSMVERGTRRKSE